MADKVTCPRCGLIQEPFIEWDEILCRSCDWKIGEARG